MSPFAPFNEYTYLKKKFKTKCGSLLYFRKQQVCKLLNVRVRTQWFTNLLTEICHFNSQKYKNFKIPLIDILRQECDPKRGILFYKPNICTARCEEMLYIQGPNPASLFTFSGNQQLHLIKTTSTFHKKEIKNQEPTQPKLPISTLKYKNLFFQTSRRRVLPYLEIQRRTA